MINIKVSISLILSLLAGATLASGAVVNLVNFQFNDANGTNLNIASDTGSLGGSWNFGGPSIQTPGSGGLAGVGSLNYGYTANFKWAGQVDKTADPTQAFRKYTLGTAVTSATHSTYTLTIDFAKWDLRQNWDTNNDSAQGKGIQISLEELDSTDKAIVTLETQGTTNFRAVSQGQGNGDIVGSFQQDFAVGNRFEANGGILEISGDLTTGAWTSRAKNTDDDVWLNLETSGTGLTQLAHLIINSKSPAIGSWGGGDDSGTYSGDALAGGTSGDYLNIDSITLTAAAVPEPATFALFGGIFALGLVLYRRRRNQLS